ncbi:Rv1733c family protein [Streptomyces caniferus]|uniref:Rv1733c family protein n=1 Tax=Streptomyces caniferus TaxID=285557 RepID=UPI003F513876
MTKEPPARIGVDSSGGGGGRPLTTVRWTAPDGTVRTGETTVAPGTKAGDRTTAWLDRQGSVVRNPATPVDSFAESIAIGTVAASSTGLLFLGTERAGARLLNRRRYAQWEKEWAEMDSRGHHHQS